MLFRPTSEPKQAGTIFPTVTLILSLLSACQSQSDPPKPASTVDSALASAAPSASSAPLPPIAPASASAIAPAPAAENISTSIDPESVNAVLVWRKDDKASGKFRSQWVVRDGDKPKLVGERPGILFVSNSSLFTLEFKVVKGCLQIARHPDGQEFVINGVLQYARPDMQMPELTRISDGAKVAPWKDGHGYPFMGTQCPSIEDYGVNVVYEGGMGPFVNATLNTYENYGGAHGFRGSNSMILDLDKLAKVELLPPEIDRPALFANAAKGFGFTLEEARSKEADMRLAGLALLYGPNGSGLAIYHYYASSSYAGSNSGTSYSGQFDVTSKNVPPEVTGYAKLPAWALSLLKPQTIPVFMIPPGKTDAFKNQFDTAYANEK